VTVLQKVIAEGMARREMPESDVEVAAAMVLGPVLQVAVFKAYGRITQDLTGLADSLAAAAWRVLYPGGVSASAP
jgi:hypothetical protein